MKRKRKQKQRKTSPLKRFFREDHSFSSLEANLIEEESIDKDRLDRLLTDELDLDLD